MIGMLVLMTLSRIILSRTDINAEVFAILRDYPYQTRKGKRKRWRLPNNNHGQLVYKHNPLLGFNQSHFQNTLFSPLMPAVLPRGMKANLEGSILSLQPCQREKGYVLLFDPDKQPS